MSEKPTVQEILDYTRTNNLSLSEARRIAAIKYVKGTLDVEDLVTFDRELVCNLIERVTQ